MTCYQEFIVAENRNYFNHYESTSFLKEHYEQTPKGSEIKINSFGSDTAKSDEKLQLRKSQSRSDSSHINLNP